MIFLCSINLNETRQIFIRYVIYYIVYVENIRAAFVKRIGYYFNILTATALYILDLGFSFRYRYTHKRPTAIYTPLEKHFMYTYMYLKSVGCNNLSKRRHYDRYCIFNLKKKIHSFLFFIFITRGVINI